MKRQLPKPGEIFEYVRLKKPELNGRKRRLENAHTIYDLRQIAKRRAPRAVFDYTDGSAEFEVSIKRARKAFEDIEFHPDILHPAPNLDISTQILGGPAAMPLGIAPTGFTRMMHAEGEVAVARAAGKAGIPFCLSTMGTTSIEDVAAAYPSGRHWFQLYVMRKREASYELVRRAQAAGYDTLLFTVDTPVAGNRIRDTRNGFAIPPQLRLSTVVNAIPRPWWWFDFLTTPKMEFESLSATDGPIGEQFTQVTDPTISFEDLDTIRGMWNGKIVVKGVQTLRDAVKLVDHGIDGIILSNHGGRQLDRAPVPFRLLPKVVKEIGDDVTIMMDTGIMSGADVVAAVALGAKFTFVGRAYLYGLMAGGQAGVERMLQIMRADIERTMQLLGVSCVEELAPRHVTQLTELVPVTQATKNAAAALA